jgi:non-homologous end joining protein Ku
VGEEPAERGGKVVDLMEALRKSLDAAKDKGEVRHKPQHRAAAKHARKRKSS